MIVLEQLPDDPECRIAHGNGDDIDSIGQNHLEDDDVGGDWHQVDEQHDADTGDNADHTHGLFHPTDLFLLFVHWTCSSCRWCIILNKQVFMILLLSLF